MERGFYNDDFDFEKLLRQRTDQVRMYPSEKVWKQIRRTIHHARYGYGLAVLLLLGAGSYITLQNELFTNSTKQEVAEINIPVVATPVVTALNTSGFNATHLQGKRPNAEKRSLNSIEKSNRNSGLQPGENSHLNVDLSTLSEYRSTDAMAGDKAIAKIDRAYAETIQQNTWRENASSISTSINSDKESTLPAILENTQSSTLQVENDVNDRLQINWLQENAVYELTRPTFKKLSWQFQVTPTVNYRNINGQKMVNISPELTSIPVALNIQGNIDNLLNHKPAMGFEMGTGVLYSLNKKLSVKAGAQFNYARYDIQAYSSSSADRATIALSTVMGSESLTSYTNIRNFGGDEVKDLKNEYFQLSIPIGLEYTVLGNRRVQFSVAGTLQPSYMLNHDNYLITTDYKNYTREPSLLRHFNLNTSAEAFLSYNMGSMKIQMGPQFRYQIFSSFVSKYPLQEHLKEFGFKLGITKTLR
jgi:hypothetical protein